MGVDDIGWVLWAGTIGLDSPIPSRVSAAQAAGYSRITVGPQDVARAEEGGTTRQELGRYLRDSGLEVVIDPVMNWCGELPPGMSFAPFSLDEVLQISDVLGAVSLSVIGPMTEMPVDDLIQAFGSICDRANDLGAQVHFEFMPMLATKDLEAAWRIVSAADRPNGGILFDTWHFFRSNPDFELLESLPGDRIFAVQVADAHAEAGDINQETFNRLLPGEGALDLVRVVSTLDRIGGLRWVGPEVISPATEAMPPAEAARLAGGRIRDLITRVRSEAATPDSPKTTPP
jgi:sugar phosphate isomerase/epimerase